MVESENNILCKIDKIKKSIKSLCKNVNIKFKNIWEIRRTKEIQVKKRIWHKVYIMWIRRRRLNKKSEAKVKYKLTRKYNIFIKNKRLIR